MVQGRVLKSALTDALQQATKWFLIEERGSDLPDELLILGDYRFEVQSLGSPGEFAIRAKSEREPNQPAFHFTVKVTGGG